MTLKVTDKDFLASWKRHASPTEVAKELGVSIQCVHKRRASLVRHGHVLNTIDCYGRNTVHSSRVEFERRRKFRVDNGVVIFFTDPHWLPDHKPTMQVAMETLVKRLKPVGVICGGDAVDGDTISRWDVTRGHHKRFTIREELDCVKEHFDGLDMVMDKHCPQAFRAFTLGNHDVRLSRFVATKCPELADMPYNRLEDWFPRWPLSWTVEINGGGAGMTILRHRNQAGMLHLQGQKAGCHYVHGHLHNLNVHVKPTFKDRLYSVDGGSIADPASEGFDYMEGNVEHVQGFTVLTYSGGKLLMPEQCYMQDGVPYFRGQPVEGGLRKAA
jgi:hypothetical protein